jgi:hypothetical protein
MKKITFIKNLSLLATLFCAVNFGFGQTVVAWEMNGNNGDEVSINATTLNANLNTSTLSRGNGINPTVLNNAFSSNNYTLNGTQSDASTNNDYLQFQISALSGYQVSLSTLDVTLRRSNTGPNTYIWKYSTDGINFNNIGTPITYTDIAGNGTSQAQINLSTIPALQNVPFGTTITFRLYAWGATNTGGTFAIGRLNGNDLSIGGIVSAAPCTTTSTWDGSNWDNGIPSNTSTEAIINGDYNTSSGSFTACSLTVNNPFTLTIEDGDFVKIQNDIVVDGTIIVNPEGAVVQVNEFATVTENGLIRVDKQTSLLNNWYEYTYWSSPVSGETIGNGLFEAQTDRRFLFNAQNYVDSTAETNNDGATVPGQDDVDDDGDDWSPVNSTDVMIPGVGYASTHSEALFTGPPFSMPPYKFVYTFEGPFNNGIITVPLYRNDSETADNNWNFIGNPYPSAIDADVFLTVNSNIATNVNIDGAIFLWSQNTPPSNTENGNEGLNFAASDYAVINAVGQTAGGDYTLPSRYISSGQGFFVSFSDAATPDSTVGDISQGTVVFNNTMRVIDNNDLFFEAIDNSEDINTADSSNGNEKNILWLNLTSDNGVFSQIAIAYANGATDAYDGWSYDTPRNLSTGTYATLYSIIDSSDRQFAIQGKSPESLNLEEVIPLGFETSIDEATLYKFSIAQLEGNFLSQNDIFIKDNLINFTHNLKESDYSFTSEVGEFTDRFEIVFTRELLSINDTKIDKNSLQIIELPNGNVQFKVSSQYEMKSIEITDLLGRTLYKLDAEGNSQTFSLSNLSQATYLAKVKLNNGFVITKKAIKRK